MGHRWKPRAGEIMTPVGRVSPKLVEQLSAMLKLFPLTARQLGSAIQAGRPALLRHLRYLKSQSRIAEIRRGRVSYFFERTKGTPVSSEKREWRRRISARSKGPIPDLIQAILSKKSGSPLKEIVMELGKRGVQRESAYRWLRRLRERQSIVWIHPRKGRGGFLFSLNAWTRSHPEHARMLETMRRETNLGGDDPLWKSIFGYSPQYDRKLERTITELLTARQRTLYSNIERFPRAGLEELSRSVGIRVSEGQIDVARLERLNLIQRSVFADGVGWVPYHHPDATDRNHIKREAAMILSRLNLAIHQEEHGAQSVQEQLEGRAQAKPRNRAIRKGHGARGTPQSGV
jgi:hypothetical protein